MNSKFNGKEVITYDSSSKTSIDSSFQGNEEETCEEITNFIVAEACRIRRLTKNGSENYERKTQALKSIYSSFNYLFKLEQFISKDLSDNLIQKIRNESGFNKFINTKAQSIKILENENTKTISNNNINLTDDKITHQNRFLIKESFKTKKNCPNFSYNDSSTINNSNINNTDNNNSSSLGDIPLHPIIKKKSSDNDSLNTSCDISQFSNTLQNLNNKSFTNIKSNDTSYINITENNIYNNKNNSNSNLIYQQNNKVSEKNSKNEDINKINTNIDCSIKDSEQDFISRCNKTFNISEATLIDNENNATPNFNSQNICNNNNLSNSDSFDDFLKESSLIERNSKNSSMLHSDYHSDSNSNKNIYDHSSSKTKILKSSSLSRKSSNVLSEYFKTNPIFKSSSVGSNKNNNSNIQFSSNTNIRNNNISESINMNNVNNLSNHNNNDIKHSNNTVNIGINNDDINNSLSKKNSKPSLYSEFNKNYEDLQYKRINYTEKNVDEQPILSNNSIKKDNKSECQYILKELIENETSFLKNLDILMNYYRLPLKENKIISNIDLNCIFYGIPELVEFSKNLCHELKEAMNEEDNILYISRVLISQVEKWDYFLRYCENYNQSKIVIKVLSKNSSGFKNFLKKAQSNNKCNKQDINSLLILPVQHGCRYSLLLTRLKEKIRANFENYNDTTIKMVDAAECYMKKLGKLLNDLQQSDEFSKYASENELNNKFMVPLSIEDCPVCYFISKDRRLLKTFNCFNTNTNKNTRIFLFGDLIMLTLSQKSSESKLGFKFKYLRIDPIENVMAQESAIFNRFKKHDFYENYVKISYSTNIFWEEKYKGQPITYTFNFSDHKTRKEFLNLFEITKSLFISNILNVASRAIPPQIDDVLVCYSNYDRRKESEISIAIGDEAVAYENAVDGWVQGENCTTHQCGYFPISVFVESDTSRDIYNNVKLKVKYSYKQKGDGEISISSGDTVIPEKYYHCSGWCYGKNLSTNEKGLFPLPYCRINFQPGFITNPKLPVVTIKKSKSNSSCYSQPPLNDANDSFIRYRNNLNNDYNTGSLPSDCFTKMISNTAVTLNMDSDDSYIEDNDIPFPLQPEPFNMISSPFIKRRSTSLDYNLDNMNNLSYSYDYDNDWDDELMN
ncbi:hypothetical protein U3516DRAFT_623072 [Neocallimastix sp. 'constans']